MNNETSYFFKFQIISFKKYFYVSLGNNFLLFCGGPCSCGGPEQLPSLPSLKFASPPRTCVSVSLLVTIVSAAETDEPIEMLLWSDAYGPWNNV